jgi:hypothetical protein
MLENNPLNEAVELHGLKPLALKMNVKYQSIQKYLRTKVTAEKVIPLSRALNWSVTPHVIRADLYPHPDDGLPEELRHYNQPAVFSNNRKVEQTAARLAHNQEVAGSNPTLATNHEHRA